MVRTSAPPETVPTNLVSKFAAQYRVVVEVLPAGQDTSLTGMSFDEISRAMRVQVQERLGASVVPDLLAEGAFILDARLARLESWQVVRRWQEPARTGEEFLRDVTATSWLRWPPACTRFIPQFRREPDLQIKRQSCLGGQAEPQRHDR